MAYYTKEHGLLIGASGADLATTYFGITHFSLTEANPVIALFTISPFLAMLLIKIGVILSVVVVSEGITKLCPEMFRHMRITLRFSFCGILLVAINNGSLILRKGLIQ